MHPKHKVRVTEGIRLGMRDCVHLMLLSLPLHDPYLFDIGMFFVRPSPLHITSKPFLESRMLAQLSVPWGLFLLNLGPRPQGGDRPNSLAERCPRAGPTARPAPTSCWSGCAACTRTGTRSQPRGGGGARLAPRGASTPGSTPLGDARFASARGALPASIASGSRRPRRGQGPTERAEEVGPTPKCLQTY